MPLPNDDPHVSDYVRVVRLRWRLVALVAAAVVVGATAFSLWRPAAAEATAIIELRVGEGAPPPDPQLERAVLKSGTVEEEVIDRLGYLPRAEASVLGATVLSMSVVDRNADRAAVAANTYADVYIEQRNALDLKRLLAGQASLEERLEDLTAGRTASGPRVDPATLRELRLAADLLSDAATSGRLAAVEAAAAQLRDAAGAGTGEALALVRRARLEQLLDELAVAVDTAANTGPQLAAAADADRVRAPAGLSRVIPVSLVIGLLLGAATALARELTDRRVRDGRDLAGGGAGEAPVIPVGVAHAGMEALRAALVLGMPQGGVVQVAGVTAGAEQVVAAALATSLSAGGREVQVLDARGGEAADGARLVEVPVTSPAFADLLQQAQASGRYVLVLSPPLATPGDGTVLARAVQGTLLVVSAGVDERGDVQAARQGVVTAHGQLVATAVVAREAAGAG
jgi:hypothetical protein